MSPRPACLTIAGSDPTGGAGIQADLRTFAAHGVHGAAAVTALTIQNSRGVSAVSSVAPDLVEAQIDAVLSDLPVAVIKIGMLGETPAAHAVARALARHPRCPVVLDPVLTSSSGKALADDGAIEVMRSDLFGRTTLLTPNLLEGERLCGEPLPSDPTLAVRRILDLGPEAVLLTGGHREGDEVVDAYAAANGTIRCWSHPRLAGSPHGTGCVLSSAIAAGVALGRSEVEAIERAIEFVRASIAGAAPLAPDLPPTLATPEVAWLAR